MERLDNTEDNKKPFRMFRLIKINLEYGLFYENRLMHKRRFLSEWEAIYWFQNYLTSFNRVGLEIAFEYPQTRNGK